MSLRHEAWCLGSEQRGASPEGPKDGGGGGQLGSPCEDVILGGSWASIERHAYSSLFRIVWYCEGQVGEALVLWHLQGR